MIAAPPLYDRPEIAAAHDRLWGRVRAALGYGPARLTRDRDPAELWTRPDLVLAQTCGLPYRTRLHGRVTLVGTLDYALPGAPPGYYYSVVVARRDAPADLAAHAGARLAYNAADSQSGWAALATHAAARGLAFAEFRATGAHAASARAVAAGEADIAALDAVSWRLIARHDPELAEALQVVDRTAATPGLPLIARAGADGPALAAAVTDAIAALDPADRDALHLRRFAAIPAADYLAVPTPPGPRTPAPAS